MCSEDQHKGGASSTGLGVSGRVVTGVVQVGEKVRVLPGDELATIRSKTYSLLRWDSYTDL